MKKQDSEKDVCLSFGAQGKWQRAYLTSALPSFLPHEIWIGGIYHADPEVRDARTFYSGCSVSQDCAKFRKKWFIFNLWVALPSYYSICLSVFLSFFILSIFHYVDKSVIHLFVWALYFSLYVLVIMFLFFYNLSFCKLLHGFLCFSFYLLTCSFYFILDCHSTSCLLDIFKLKLSWCQYLILSYMYFFHVNGSHPFERGKIKHTKQNEYPWLLMGSCEEKQPYRIATT